MALIMRILSKPADKLTSALLLAVLDYMHKLLVDHLQYQPAPLSYDILDPELIKALTKRHKKFLRNPDSKVYLLKDKNGIHGTALGVPWTDYKDNTAVSSFYIDPEYRRQGFGQKILLRILLDARKKKLKRILIGYFNDNPAKSLYLRNGYRPFSSQAVKEL